MSINQPNNDAPLTLYLTGGLLHIGLGLEVLDNEQKPVGITMWDFGSRNHYSYKDEEWITGKKNGFGSLNNLSLLAGTTEGEMRSWDPTKRFDMTLEEFINSEKIKVKLPITHQQRQTINDWVTKQTKTFNEHHYYEQLSLNIWFSGGVPYNMFNYSCTTWICDALFIGGIFTEDNLPKKQDQTEPVPSRWISPLKLLNHFANTPVLSAEQLKHEHAIRHQKIQA
jgi:hypothetical protein